MSRKALTATFLAVFVFLLAAPAYAHGERDSTDPESGATLKRPPKHVYVNLTEPPTSDALMNVTDGCGREVLKDLAVVERTLHATLSRGEPGEWRVRYRAISKVDGHATKDTFSFAVSGAKDCSVAPEDPDPEEDPQTAAGDDDSGSDPEEGSGLGSGTFVAIIGVLGVLILGGILWTVRSIIAKREE